MEGPAPKPPILTGGGRKRDIANRLEKKPFSACPLAKENCHRKLSKVTCGKTAEGITLLPVAMPLEIEYELQCIAGSWDLLLTLSCKIVLNSWQNE